MSKGGKKFSRAELAEVLGHYDLGIIHQVKPLLAGNAKAPKVVLTAEKGKFLLKRRAKGRADEYRVAFAHSLQDYLVEKKFPVPTLVPISDDDNTILQLNDQVYEVFTFINGRRYDGSEEATFDAGRELALFHKHLAAFESKWKPLRETFHNSLNVRSHFKAISKANKALTRLTDSLSALYDKSSGMVNELGFTSWDEQIIHGDWHPGNMLFSGRKIVAIIDFDSAKMAPAAIDLANGMLHFSIVAGRPNPADWPSYLDQAKLVRFLSGYRTIAEMEEKVLASLVDLMIEALIAEAVSPVAVTGFFGHLSGLDFLKMILRKAEWIDENRNVLIKAICK